MSYVVEAENLTKIFHSKSEARIVALKQVSFQIEPGEWVLLVGPNGAGKTTLLKILATLVLPNQGDFSIFGCKPFRQEKEIRRKIGLVSREDRSFYWPLTGRQNLNFFGGLFGLSAREIRYKVEEYKEVLGFSFLDQRVKEYSSGMRQRLALVRALLHDPDLLLLDEPTQGLDVKTREHFLEFLKMEWIQKRGKTILMVTHQPEEVKKFGQRFFALQQGRLSN